jgi:multiple sugar transport system substrate-binding protein
LLATGATAVALGLAGCSGGDGTDTPTATSTATQGDGDGGGGTDTPTPTATAEPSFPSEITFLHQETQEERRKAVAELGEAFADETGTSIKQRVVPQADLPQEITSALATGQLPAAAEMGLRATFATRDAIDSDAVNEVMADLGEDTFNQNLLRFVQNTEGDYLGVPFYAWTQLMCYRIPVFEEMGLEPPRTWDQILANAEALHEPDDNQFGILIGTNRSQFTLQCFTPFAKSNDAHVFSPEGDIVFDSDAMVEALDFYRQLNEYTPPGSLGPSDVGPAWNNEQVHMYSSNSIAFYFEAAFSDAETVTWFGAEPFVENERQATFGQVVSTNVMQVEDAGATRAAKEWSKFLRGTPEDRSNYLRWLDLNEGLFQPVFPDVTELEAYRNNDVITNWPERWTEEVQPTSFEKMELFGFRGDTVFPEIGEITGNFLVTEAVVEVLDGNDPEKVATEKAEEMREAIQ